MNPNVRIESAPPLTPKRLEAASAMIDLVNRHGLAGAINGLLLATLALHDGSGEHDNLTRDLIILDRNARRHLGQRCPSAPASDDDGEEMELTEKATPEGGK